jgi:hypothetical protein
MRRIINFFFFSASMFHCRSQQAPASTTAPVEAPVTAVVGGSTITETFTATSLSQYASTSGTSSVTITDNTGAIILAGVVFAGGLAWLLKPVPNVPILDPPTTPPNIITEQPSTETSTPTSTATTTTSDAPALPTLDALVNSPPDDFFATALPQIILLEDDQNTCGFANDDPAEISRDDADKRINDFCKDNNGKPVNINAPITMVDAFDAGTILNLTVTQNSGCSGETDLTLDEDDCNSFLHETLDNCDTNTLTQKHGGTLNDDCFTYSFHVQSTPPRL